MRGKVMFTVKNIEGSRITPAYAGKREKSRSTAFNEKDHPRVCGEKFHPASVQALSEGITPAYAGKSHVYSKKY